MRFTLTAETAVQHLRQRRLAPHLSSVRVTPVGGGVSSVVIRVDAKEGAWILKQPLARFNVAQQWHVDERRAGVEFAFANLIEQRLGPGVVAQPLDFDPERMVLVTRAAAPGFVPWKQQLLAGHCEPKVAGKAGALLAMIHRLGAPPDFSNIDLFHQQRIDPYFGALAALHPKVSPRIGAITRALNASRQCLIHGDFSPKNILTDGQQVLLVDHEVATLNDPRFDVAFLLSHLLLKAFRGVDAAQVQDLVDEFLYMYGRNAGPAASDARACDLLAALLLARVDGKSPVEYLSPARREQVRGFALRSLLADVSTPEELVVEALASIKA